MVGRVMLIYSPCEVSNHCFAIAKPYEIIKHIIASNVERGELFYAIWFIFVNCKQALESSNRNTLCDIDHVIYCIYKQHLIYILVKSQVIQ